jgi:hypothetical protein
MARCHETAEGQWNEKMSTFATWMKIAGVVAGVVVAGVVIGVLGTGGWRPESVAPEPAPPAADAGDQKAASRPVETAAASVPAGAVPAAMLARAEGWTAAELKTNWEDKVEEILASKAAEADKARKMLEMFPRLPEKGQVEVSQHLANLVSDSDYAGLERYLTNASLPEPVLDVLVADLLNRPNSVKLPALLAVARDPQNPKAGEAKSILQLFLEEDHGSDWNAWQAKVDQWLKDNPD